VCFHGTPSHLQLFADFVVVASLKQKVGNLLLPRSEPDRRIFHTAFPNSMNRRTSPNKNKDLTEAARSRLFTSPPKKTVRTCTAIPEFIASTVPSRTALHKLEPEKFPQMLKMVPSRRINVGNRGVRVGLKNLERLEQVSKIKPFGRPRECLLSFSNQRP
jgi:hypothetical protein